MKETITFVIVDVKFSNDVVKSYSGLVPHVFEALTNYCVENDVTAEIHCSTKPLKLYDEK